MARKLNEILSEIDAGKKPEVDQAGLLLELSKVVATLAKGSKLDPKPGTINTPDGVVDFKYATVNDKLALANTALRKALVTARGNMQDIVALSAAEYTEDQMDEMIDKEATAIIIANGQLRNLTVASKSSLF